MSEKEVFEGLKVADFGWSFVGPCISKQLADFGATVVHVESVTHLCPGRVTPPYMGGKPGVNRGILFPNANTNKYGIALNLNQPGGIEVAKRLVTWSDVVVESFTPGIMEKWGLGYEEVKRINPGVIMLSTNAQGAGGPYSSLPGIGMQISALSGFNYYTGWPDGESIAPYGPYTDVVSPRFGTTALIAALIYRSKTGKGQHVEVSQYEAGVNFLVPALLDCIVNGNAGTLVGNRCTYACPHSVYPCKGQDRWCAITVFTDHEWESFCHVLGNPPWTRGKKFSTLLNRKRNEDELDKLVAEFTINFNPEEIVSIMQSASVPAGVVMNGKDLSESPELAELFLWDMQHPELGHIRTHGQVAKLSKTPARLRMPSPCLGEHTLYVCEHFLKMSDSEFMELMEDGVFT